MFFQTLFTLTGHLPRRWSKLLVVQFPFEQRQVAGSGKIPKVAGRSDILNGEVVMTKNTRALFLFSILLSLPGLHSDALGQGTNARRLTGTWNLDTSRGDDVRDCGKSRGDQPGRELRANATKTGESPATARPAVDSSSPVAVLLLPPPRRLKSLLTPTVEPAPKPMRTGGPCRPLPS